MAVQQERDVDTDQLTNADEQILDELHEGARTKKALVDATGLHRNTVGNRLDVLEAGDAVHCIHETTALYELRYDPRESDADAGDDQRRLRESVEALKNERGDLQEQLADAHERIDELEERLRQQRVTADRIVDDIEAALEAGAERRVEAALERLDDLASGGGE